MSAVERIVEAYIGEYASGKSEVSINRAIELARAGRQVTLVDLDTVEPFYTLRPIQEQLQAEGLNIISLSKEQSFGLGETGAMLHPKARWALHQEGDVIMDIGYGVHGAKILNMVEGAEQSEQMRIIAVINAMRPMNDSVDRILAYFNNLGRVDAIVANTHLGKESTLEVIEHGNAIIYVAAAKAGVPIEFITYSEKWEQQIDPAKMPYPVKFLKLFMPRAFW